MGKFHGLILSRPELSNRTFCIGGNVLCCPVWEPLDARDYWAVGVRLVQHRNWILNLNFKFKWHMITCCHVGLHKARPLVQGLANYDPWATSSWLFVNKVLLAYNKTHSLIYCLWLLSGTRVELWQRLHEPQSWRYLLLVLYWNCFLIPAFSWF